MTFSLAGLLDRVGLGRRLGIGSMRAIVEGKPMSRIEDYRAVEDPAALDPAEGEDTDRAALEFYIWGFLAALWLILAVVAVAVFLLSVDVPLRSGPAKLVYLAVALLVSVLLANFLGAGFISQGRFYFGRPVAANVAWLAIAMLALAILLLPLLPSE